MYCSSFSGKKYFVIIVNKPIINDTKEIQAVTKATRFEICNSFSQFATRIAKYLKAQAKAITTPMQTTKIITRYHIELLTFFSQLSTYAVNNLVICSSRFFCSGVIKGSLQSSSSVEAGEIRIDFKKSFIFFFFIFIFCVLCHDVTVMPPRMIFLEYVWKHSPEEL